MKLVADDFFFSLSQFLWEKSLFPWSWTVFSFQLILYHALSPPVIDATLCTEQSTAPRSKDYQARYEALWGSDSDSAMQALLHEWEAASPTDPEMFIANFNYYYYQSQQEMLTLTEEAPKGESLVLTDSASDGPTGYLGSQIFYQDSLFQLSQQYLDRGMAQHPRRLDMYFGQIYSLREAGYLEQHLTKLLAVIDTHQSIGGDWLWSNGKPLEADEDPEAYFTGSIQEYISVFYQMPEPYIKGIDTVSRRMLALYPEDVRFNTNVGVASLFREDFVGAIPWFEQALKAEPHDPIVLNNLAYAYREMGQQKEATQYYEAVIEHGTEEDAAYARQALREMQGRSGGNSLKGN